MGDRELRKGSSILPPVLKADSEATVEMGIANTSRANWENAGYFEELAFHQANISNVTSFAPS